jgi:hypothetical protein
MLPGSAQSVPPWRYIRELQTLAPAWWQPPAGLKRGAPPFDACFYRWTAIWPVRMSPRNVPRSTSVTARRRPEPPCSRIRQGLHPACPCRRPVRLTPEQGHRKNKGASLTRPISFGSDDDCRSFPRKRQSGAATAMCACGPGSPLSRGGAAVRRHSEQDPGCTLPGSAQSAPRGATSCALNLRCKSLRPGARHPSPAPFRAKSLSGACAHRDTVLRCLGFLASRLGLCRRRLRLGQVQQGDADQKMRRRGIQS